VNAEALAEGVLAGDRRSLSRAITTVESDKLEDEPLALELLDRCLPATGRSLRIGISGPPGVGKSTLIDALGVRLIERGARPSVLAIDPSSQKTHGSVLGDKTRMARLAARPEAFIRPSPSRGESGGLAPRTREAMLLCEAAGFDRVLVETVGIGQSELAVADLVDCLVVLVAPGAGDELQGMKRGILEHADLLVVTKADGTDLPRAEQARSELESALGLFAHAAERAAVLLVSATTGSGVDALAEAVHVFHESAASSGAFGRRRAAQDLAWFEHSVARGLRARLWSRPELVQRKAELERALLEGKLSARAAARELVDLALPNQRA
jgi:LAO/AO transport system kinase